MALDRRLQSVGLPDDLAEVALRDAPSPDAAAAARIRARVLQAAAGAEGPSTVRRRRAWPWVAAAAIAALAIATPAGSGFMRGLLRFVPGFGLQATVAGERALAHTVRVATGYDTIYVTGVLASRSGTEVLFSIVGPDVQMPAGGVRLEDARGRVYRASTGSWAFGLGSPSIGTGGFDFPALRDPAGPVTLILPLEPTVRVVLPLVAASDLPAAAQLPAARAHGITLAVQATRHGAEALLTLLATRTPAGTRAIGFGGWNRPLKLVGAGRSFALHAVPNFGGPIQAYSAPVLPPSAKSAQLVVPSVEIQLQGSVSVKIPVPPSGSLAIGKSLAVGPATAHITKVQRLSGNRIRLTLRDSGTAALADPGFLSINRAAAGAMTWTLSRGGAIRTMTLAVPQGDWWVSLGMANPQVVVQGPWRVTVPLASARTAP
ncbi:MAG: hypothetical protein M0Z66_06665 [Thermaerobacter sp.]|nr:hypothetical protein [Thermaerobacter sp.]